MEKTQKYNQNKLINSRQNDNTSYLIKVALLSAIAYIVFLFEFPIPFFPPFLEIDLSDVVAVLGGIILGPIAAGLIEVIKNLLRYFLMNSGTGGIGEMANLFVGVAFVLPFCLIYRANNIKLIILGCLTGIVSMTLTAVTINYLIMIPLYTGINSHIEKMNMIYSIYIPFNIVKGVIVSVVSFITVFSFKEVIHRLRQ
ncbi:MAG: ECF transporter S component [Vallitalea sp.]|jgi:riboflavin transporter FmnP|nr:ECF transporter S component [Vallitalea sp.]